MFFFVFLTLVHRLRRWTNVKPALFQSLVYAGSPHIYQSTFSAPGSSSTKNHDVSKSYYTNGNIPQHLFVDPASMLKATYCEPVHNNIIGIDGSLIYILIDKIRPLGYERVYLPLRKVADTPFHSQGDEMSTGKSLTSLKYLCLIELKWTRFESYVAYISRNIMLFYVWGLHLYSLT